MDHDFRKAALDYHRLPRPGKLSIEPTKTMATQRDLALAYSPGGCRGLRGDQGRSERGVRLHGARQPGGGDLQRHRRAGAGQYRAAGEQAGDGGQGRPVQKVRRHRRVRHRSRCGGSGQILRRRGSAGADLRRDQPGRHQSAGMLRDRGGTAVPDAHPGVSRRPARHRHHRSRRGAQWAAAAGQGPVGRKTGHLGGRCRGSGLRRSAGLDGAAAGKRHADRHQGRGEQEPARHAAEHGALCPRHQRQPRCGTLCRAPTSSWACPRPGS